jgi:hypothetical protein
VEKQTHFDFVTSIGLMILSLVMIVDSYRMGVDVGGALYASPGMLPMVLALLLLLTSTMLLRRSIRSGGLGKNLAGFLSWFDGFRRSGTAREMMLGVLILAFYTFIMAPRLPFWMSTSIFMILVMAILKATSITKSILITALVVGSIYGIFQVIFHVPLP